VIESSGSNSSRTIEVESLKLEHLERLTDGHAEGMENKVDLPRQLVEKRSQAKDLKGLDG
jgi:hypothetical protein